MGKKRKDAATASTEKKEPLVDLSEEDQWRIIRESGVLKKIVPETKEEPQEEQLLSPFTEEVFAALALIIPHCALLLMMEMYVLLQYTGFACSQDDIAWFTTSTVGSLHTKNLSTECCLALLVSEIVHSVTTCRP